MILMSRVQNESQVAGRVRAHQRAAIHHGRRAFQALGKLDRVDRCVDRGKRAQHAIRFEAWFKGRVAFRIKRFRGRHPAPHPQDDHGVRGRTDFLVVGSKQLPGFARAQGGQRGRAGGAQEIPAVLVRQAAVVHGNGLDGQGG